MIHFSFALSEIPFSLLHIWLVGLDTPITVECTIDRNAIFLYNLSYLISFSIMSVTLHFKNLKFLN